MINEVLKQFLSNLELGEPQHFKNVIIFPVFSKSTDNVEYITLSEAIKNNSLIIEEVNGMGTVPELKVINKSLVPVLIIDGEELKGLKQNRIVNTTILLKENSETIIPVSCVEEGRWNFDTEVFACSKNVAFFSLRKEKATKVEESLKRKRRFDSDQSDIWDEVMYMMRDSNTFSDTGAMSDIFDNKQSELSEFLNYFKLLPRQKGLIVLINGKVAGFDIVSSESAYKNLHEKLVKSYVLDAIAESKKNSKDFNNAKEKVDEFFKNILDCEEKSYDSIGYGRDFRYKSNSIIGSALIYKNSVIHASFFNDQAQQEESPAREEGIFEKFKSRFARRKKDQTS